MDSKTFESRRLSTRWKANHQLRRVLQSAFIILTGVFIISCNEMGKGQDLTNPEDHLTAAADSLNKPSVNITVNKRYDDEGNLIGMDSTYSSYYSNIEGDTARMDSLFFNFDRLLNSHRPSMFDDNFNDLFFNDSLRYHDFFHDDFFMKRYELNDAYLRDMMRRMDSLKNQFYEEESRQRRNSADL